MKKLCILLIVETGLLEQQAKLLVESIDKFVRPRMPTDIFAFSPRANRKADAETVRFFQQYNVHYIADDLNQKYDHFPLANGLVASAYFEKHHPEYEHVILSDTDTVFINPLPAEIFTGPSCYVSPADNKGVGSSGEGDKNDLFWQGMFGLFGMTCQAPEMITTVRQDKIRPYHNSGFVLVNQIKNFYTQWFADFDRLMSSTVRPEFIGRDGTNFGFFEQVVLSITSMRHIQQKRYFPTGINYPIPFRPMMKAREAHPDFAQLVHIHYHKWFQHPGFLEHVTSDEDKQSEQYQWLQSRLPLAPTIEEAFKC